MLSLPKHGPNKLRHDKSVPLLGKERRNFVLGLARLGPEVTQIGVYIASLRRAVDFRFIFAYDEPISDSNRGTGPCI